MGRVWRAVDEILDRLVAVKEMRIDGLDPEDTRTRRERTLREARATARIDHPNVVRVYDVVDEGERLWIVMELVAGRSLERIMAEEGPLGPCETARIGIGLLAALRQVHARGVLHRDIKPGNVLVETEVTRARGRGRVVLTDFGIAAIQDAKALTMVGMLVGSPDYMAPERISGRPQGPPSDIWSLGATLSAALAGRSPFSRDTTLATLHAVLYEEPELPSTAGPLREVLAALLEKDPTLRPGLDDLETALEPVAFPVPTPTMPVVGGGGGAPREGTEEPGGGGNGSAVAPGVRRGTEVEGGTGGGGAGGVPGPGPLRGRGGVEGEAGAGGDGAEAATGFEHRGTGAEGEAAGQEPGSDRPLEPEPGESFVPGAPGAVPERGPEQGTRSEAESWGGTTAGGDLSRAEPADGFTPEPGWPHGPEPELGPASGSGSKPELRGGSVPEGGAELVGRPDSGPYPYPPSEPERTGVSLHEPGQTGQSLHELEQTGQSLHEPGQTGGPTPEPGQVHAPTPGLQPTHASGPGLQPPHGPGPEPTTAHGPGPEPTPAHGLRPEPTPAHHPGPGLAPPLPTPTPESPARESPTPACLEASLVPPAPGLRQPEDVRDAIPPPPSAPTDDARTENARTEATRADDDVRHTAANTWRYPTPTPLPDHTFTPDRTSTPSPATEPTRAPNASTELASQPRSEVRSPAPAGNADGALPRRPGVSLARSEAVTEQRPAPGPGHTPGGSRPYGVMPPGELPGPAVPAEQPRRGRRRRGKVAALGIVAAGAVVAVILATDPGSPKDDQAGSAPSGPSSTASSPGAGPSSTVEGTSRPQSLPPGSRREAGGFAWVPPEDWRRDVKTGSEVHYTSPDAAQELAAKSSLARDDLMDSWQKSEENARQGQQYRKIRLERTRFRGHPAVVWEYTFTLQGDPWHAQLLGFTVDGKSYQINTWYRPYIETEALKTYEKVKDTFTVL